MVHAGWPLGGAPATATPPRLQSRSGRPSREIHGYGFLIRDRNDKFLSRLDDSMLRLRLHILKTPVRPPQELKAAAKRTSTGSGMYQPMLRVLATRRFRRGGGRSLKVLEVAPMPNPAQDARRGVVPSCATASRSINTARAKQAIPAMSKRCDP